MQQEDLREEMLTAWVQLNGALKDSQVTVELTYNEAVVMLLLYRRYDQDGVGRMGVQELLKETSFLKSLMNRTVDSLYRQGYLRKEKAGRNLYVILCPERIPDFLAVHNRSLGLAQQVIDVIGAEDAAEFVRISKKLINSDWKIERTR